jgi:UDP-N-acetylglucosamine 2-epimerase (non-hydrolysing)
VKQIFIAVIVGARPNFMKAAPLLRQMDQQPQIASTLIHTGQHYDRNLSEVFFEELRIKSPDVSLNCSGSTHAAQTAQVLERTESVLLQGPHQDKSKPFAAVIVVGDVNSTMAAALAAVKLGIPVAHIEAGLRSFDRSMPEEINRIVTDSISQLLFVSEPAGVDNLKAEGHSDADIYLVGNLMIDTLRFCLDSARSQPVLQQCGLQPGSYATVTMHRPSNVDDPETLQAFIDVLIEVSNRLPIVLPLHPRTRARLEASSLLTRLESAPRVQVLEPLGYLSFLCLNSHAKVIITDSGGLQEESTALGIPCLTLRSNTERPVTVQQGTSTLVGADPAKLQLELEAVLSGNYKSGSCPRLWDGHAAPRIVDILIDKLAVC